MFGQFEPTATLSDFITRRIDTLDEAIQEVAFSPRLHLLPGTGETLATANPTYATKKRLERHLRKLDADLVILDVGAGANYHALDFCLWADFPIVVATPDPTAVLDVYKFVKLATIRRVLSVFLARDRVSKTLAGRNFTRIEDIVAAVRDIDPEAELVAQEALATFRPLLLVNNASETSKLNANHLRKVLKQFVGSDLDLLAEIPRDEMVSKSVRRFTPVVEMEPDSPAARAYRQATEALLERVRAHA
jgi:flagellar biosynthesis protein FlhG